MADFKSKESLNREYCDYLLIFCKVTFGGVKISFEKPDIHNVKKLKIITYNKLRTNLENHQLWSKSEKTWKNRKWFTC